MRPLLEEIRRHGPVTFARYMEIALYHPECGYYCTRGSEITGRQGDFFTSSDLGPLFGLLLAEDVVGRWHQLGCPGPFDVIEYGAGRGYLAHDLLRHLKEAHPDLYRLIRYRIVEISPSLMAKQRDLLDGLPVSWSAPGDPLPPAEGIVIANEVIDAFPVHRVRLHRGMLEEAYVTADEGRLVEVWRQPSTSELAGSLQECGIVLGEGQQAEINLAAKRWLCKVARFLRSGFVLIFDYGDEAEKLYERNPRGTLMTYSRHRADPDYLVEPGRRDITAHVNFTAIMNWGKQVGFGVESFARQGRYVLQRGLLERLLAKPVDPKESFRRSAALKRLILPEGMGEVFAALVLQRI